MINCAIKILRSCCGQRKGIIIWAPLKTPLLRFGRIFRSNFALRKSRNTQSIPEFPQLNLKQNISPKSSKKSFQRLPKRKRAEARIMFPRLRSILLFMLHPFFCASKIPGRTVQSRTEPEGRSRGRDSCYLRSGGYPNRRGGRKEPCPL